MDWGEKLETNFDKFIETKLNETYIFMVTKIIVLTKKD